MGTTPSRRDVILGAAAAGLAAAGTPARAQQPPAKKDVVVEVEEGGKKKVYTREDMVGSFRTKYTTAPPPVDPALLVPDWAGKARTAVRLHPRREKPAAGSSHLGGMVLWPKAEAWPTCARHKTALVPVLELRKADVPEAGFRPGTDLLQLLWCPHDHPDDHEAATFLRPVAYWRKSADLGQLLAAAPDPGKVDKDYVPRPCVLHPERVAEYPSGWELGEKQKADLDAGDWKWLLKEVNGRLRDEQCHADSPFELYLSWLGAAPGTKVGGHPRWIQDPEYPKCVCGAAMSHWMTFESWEWDAGSYPRWMPVEYGGDRFGKGDDQHAADWMFGDAGAAYLFVCRACKDWPVASLMQCG